MEIKVECEPSTALKKFVLKIRDEASFTKSSGFMHKVPKQLRDVNEKAYEPEVVSIGPNYHGRDEFKKMEEMKVNNMLSLLKRKPEVTLEDYYSLIEPVVQEALDCYGEAMSLKRDEFIGMLVLDACFIIELISRRNDTDTHSRWRNSVQRDLLLLENQIPFFVLSKLFDIIHHPRDLKEDVLRFFHSSYPGLLLIPDSRTKTIENITHILDLVHFNWCINSSDKLKPGSILPSASKLKKANVKFFGGGIDLFDVKFEKDRGELVMGMLIIKHGTESVLRNLIAYEQTFPSEKSTPFTNYALLLDNLVNDANDVEILYLNWIISNHFHNEEVVADFINRLTYKIVSNDEFSLAELYDDIRSYYFHQEKKGVVRWNEIKAEFHEKYFNSPWSFIAVVAATVLLLLTVAQTVFAATELYRRP